MLPRILLTLLLVLPAIEGRAQQPNPYLNATLTIANTPPSQNLQRGTVGRIQANPSKCLGSVPGCPFNFDRTSLYFHLPAGLTYSHHTASSPLHPMTCTSAPVSGGASVVSCSGGSLAGYQGSNWHSQLLLYVNVAEDMPLGQTRLVMAVDDNLPQDSVTLAECLDDIYPNYCDDFTATVEVAPAPKVIIEAAWHHPTVFQPDTPSSLVVFARNNGNLASTHTHIQVALPPGLQWQLATTSTVGPLMTCTASGAWATGQTVTCSGAGLPATTSGTVQLTLGIRPRAAMEYPGPLVAVGAVNDGPNPEPAVLSACALDPSPAHCMWHEIPTFVPCAYAYEDGVFCDGFDPLQPVFVHPLREDDEE
jgi:hypothetical protein